MTGEIDIESFYSLNFLRDYKCILLFESNFYINTDLLDFLIYILEKEGKKNLCFCSTHMGGRCFFIMMNYLVPGF